MKGIASGQRVPDTVECAGCGRTLERSEYAALPSQNVPEKMITRFSGGWLHYGVQCTCGHYTVWEFSPRPGSSSTE